MHLGPRPVFPNPAGVPGLSGTLPQTWRHSLEATKAPVLIVAEPGQGPLAHGVTVSHQGSVWLSHAKKKGKWLEIVDCSCKKGGSFHSYMKLHRITRRKPWVAETPPKNADFVGFLLPGKNSGSDMCFSWLVWDFIWKRSSSISSMIYFPKEV